MAECKKYRDMISCFADGELSGIEKEKLQKHLEECPSCRSLLSLYSSVSEAAAGSLLDPPDSFSDSVMSKIKSLSENTDTVKHAGSKRPRSIRPVVISFVAMAACLALVLIVAPGFFGLSSTKNSADGVPMAPGASLQAAPDEEDAQYYVMRSDAAADTAELADSHEKTADAAETGPQATMGITAVTNTPPETAAGEEQPLAATGGAADELTTYYAVFVIEGQLPEILESKVGTDNGDGTFNIEISADTAEKLIADGLPAKKGAPNAVIALVKYTPDP